MKGRLLLSLTVALATLAASACDGPVRPTPTPTPTAPPARTEFGPGQYRVGIDIAPGRYFTGPSDFTGPECRWERAWLGGKQNDPIETDAQQWIVDILPSDTTFKVNCGSWFKDSPRTGALTTIPHGVWLVGTQVAPGLHRSDGTEDGCTWATMRDFALTGNSLSQYGFVGSDAGPQEVKIDASDTGFLTTRECGTWTRVSGSE